MVCGSAPGSPAPTLITGKSIFGREATGRKLKARIPDNSSAAASSDVPIGLRIKGAEIFIVHIWDSRLGCPGERRLRDSSSAAAHGVPVRLEAAAVPQAPNPPTSAPAESHFQS